MKTIKKIQILSLILFLFSGFMIVSAKSETTLLIFDDSNNFTPGFINIAGRVVDSNAKGIYGTDITVTILKKGITSVEFSEKNILYMTQKKSQNSNNLDEKGIFNVRYQLPEECESGTYYSYISASNDEVATLKKIFYTSENDRNYILEKISSVGNTDDAKILIDDETFIQKLGITQDVGIHLLTLEEKENLAKVFLSIDKKAVNEIRNAILSECAIHKINNTSSSEMSALLKNELSQILEFSSVLQKKICFENPEFLNVISNEITKQLPIKDIFSLNELINLKAAELAFDFTPPNVSISSLTAKEGEYVSLPITLDTPQKVLGFKFEFNYNNLDLDFRNEDFPLVYDKSYFYNRPLKQINKETKYISFIMPSKAVSEAAKLSNICELKMIAKEFSGSVNCNITIDFVYENKIVTIHKNLNSIVSISDINSGYNPPISGGGTSGGGSGGAYVKEDKPIEPYPKTDKEKPFTDLQNTPWAQESITYLTTKGIISGFDDNTYRPNNNVTRAEFVTLISKAFKLTDISDMKYIDVLTSDWFFEDISKATKAGIINGISENKFAPNSYITREDIAVVCDRVFKFMKLKSSNLGIVLEYYDEDEFSDYAKDSIAYISKLGIMNGVENGKFDPKGLATRAMAAKVVFELVRFMN